MAQSNKTTLLNAFKNGKIPTSDEFKSFVSSSVNSEETTNQYIRSTLSFASGSNDPFHEICPPFVPNLHHQNIKVFTLDIETSGHEAIFPDIGTNDEIWETDTDNSSAVAVISDSGGDHLNQVYFELTCGSSAGHQTALATAPKPFKCATGKPFWLKTKFHILDIDAVEFFFGVSEQAADTDSFHLSSPAAGKDRVGFIKEVHSSENIGYAVSKNTGGVIAQAFDPAFTIQQKELVALGIYWDGKGNIKFYAGKDLGHQTLGCGDMKLRATYSTAANIPDDSNMHLVFMMENGSSGAEKIQFECIQGAILI